MFRGMLGILVMASAVLAQPIRAPRHWNDRELADWATPVVGLSLRPGHFSEREFYAAPLDEYTRTYPVYFPGHEPEGYWQMLQSKKPEPLLVPGPRTTAEWIAGGKIVFRELDVPIFRTYDPKIIAIARSVEEWKKLGGHPQKDGTVFGLRWIKSSKGLGLAVSECAGCHIRIMPDGSMLDGPQFNDPGDGLIGKLVNEGIAAALPGDGPAMVQWRQFAVPWIPNDTHERLKKFSEKEFEELFASIPPGVFPRFNGSPFYPTKTPDLIGIKDRKYIDHTATHRLRGPADLMRYAALVTTADPADFGPHRMLSDKQRIVLGSFTDDLLFALASYLWALEPPANPHPKDARSEAGRRIFTREGCAGCHTPPLYTNNKLTLAAGYTPPKDHPLRADIMPISVGTDPNLALKTRKGTGLYKVPSLKGVWYRGLLNHDGSVATLEDWFDPARLRDDYVPTGFKGYKVERRAVSGHEFGLKLPAEEKTALIAFLRTL